MDKGEQMTEQELRRLDKKIVAVYQQAEREIKQKLDDFVEKHRKKNDEMLQKLSDGLITKEEYKNWLSIQIFQRKQWETKLKQIQKILLNASNTAVDIIRTGQFDVFAANYNFFVNAAGRIVSAHFNLYDSRVVARLIAKNPQLLPRWKIDEFKEYKWSRMAVQNVIRQGIIQGESIEGITRRMVESLGSRNRQRMRLFARTAVTEAENAGRMEMLRDQLRMGIRVKKKWLATHDNRTRDSHREINGEVAEVKDTFSNGLMYPGDPNGNPAEVYNCRCTLTYVYPDFM